MTSERIAVIAVHGVADQSAGSTARSLVDLLVATSHDGAVYQARDSESITLGVDPHPPINRPTAAADATPLGEQRTLTKAILQSLRSDFQREGWTAADSRQGWHASQARPTDPDDDRGIAFSAYLLGKNLRNGAARESHVTTRIGMQRSAAGSAGSRVDMFEMYWADLSRLSGAMPRIVTELFTMIFRLSKLGRETVDEARTAAKLSDPDNRSRRVGWSIAAWLQIGLDWLFANVLAMLFLQLALLAVMLVALGLLAMLDPLLLAHVDRIAAALVAIVGLLIFAYRYKERRWQALLPPLLLVATGSLALWVVPALAPWVALLVLLGLVTVASEAGLRVADDRFPLVRRIGRLMWFSVVAVVVFSTARQYLASPGIDLSTVARASIVGVELALLCIKWTWIIIGAVMPIWLIGGWLAARGAGYEAKASVATGRLGLGLSLSAFLAITMTTWALTSGFIEASVHGIDHAPCIFSSACTTSNEVLSSAQAEVACPWIAAGGPLANPADWFLHQRFVASTSGFALVAVVLMGLMAFLLAMFLPSVLAEMNVIVKRARKAGGNAASSALSSRAAAHLAAAFATNEVRARRLGRWLTAGYRNLDEVSHAVIGAGVGLGLLVAFAFVDLPGLVNLGSIAANLSQGLLEPMIISAASVAAALVIFGGLFSRYLPGIRGPLDIALDVDNHFREFPRTRIPRARIFSRYVALLRHISAGGYDHIVIVAHSQGSVISAELLRYLASDGRHAPAAGDRPRIDGQPLPPISLLTVGCPLRQLYAARFPTLYRWVLARRGGVSGPLAADIGVERWVNAFCSGDYVGRWLWSDEPAADQDPLAHPMVESVDRRFGRTDAYAGFDPMPPDALPFDQASEAELCLGLGAHTQYFEPGQTTVAWLVDRLIAR